MTKRQAFFIITALVALVWGTVCAQAPQGFGYQAVVRDAVGRVVSDRQVTVRLSLLQGSADGTPRYAETHTATTDAAGLFTLTVGAGTPASGTFAAIDWAAGPWFLRSEVDPDGGSNFTLSTTQQLLSVPYALFATQADRSGSDAALRTSLDSLARTVPTVPSNVSAFTNDAGYLTSYTETQVLSISHDTLFLTGGSFVKLPAGFSGNYNDLANRPSIPTVPANVSAFTNDAGYLTSYTETQTLAQAAALGNSVNTQVKGVSDPTDPQDAVNLRTLDSALALLARRLDSLASTSQQGNTSSAAGIRFVDLGLPSGLLWATCNLGATTPEGYGNYYAWGETTTKSDYSWETYRYCNGSSITMTKYCSNSSYGYNGYTDALTTLQAMDDAATQALGSGARTPTKDEWNELINNTTSTWTTRNGVNGWLFTAPNGNSLFLPAAGCRDGTSLGNAGSGGSYWSSSLNTGSPGHAWDFDFNSGGRYMDSDNRDSRGSGQSVRAVRASQNTPTPCTTTTGDTNATATGSFSWHGTTYTASGDYRDTLVNAAGCDSIVTLHLTIAPTPTTTTWVDLGLPSGLLWAECNLGATTPEGYGNYYAWGETDSKNEYNWSNYRFGNGEEYALNKYCNDAAYGLNGFSDGLTALQAMDDAATQSLGNGARTPTKVEWDELLSNTTGEWTTQNDVYGYRLTAANGNSLFLPAAGWNTESGYWGYGSDGSCYYWSASLREDYPLLAWGFINFSSGEAHMDGNGRYLGFPVRAVHGRTTAGTCTPTYGDTTASATGSFNWHGECYTASGNYRDTLTNARGCDSVVTLHLTIAPTPTTTTWVDLGLPSGLLWAECNLGAATPEDYGNYYAWGETSPKCDYSWITYRYCNGSAATLTKYCNNSDDGYNGFTDALTTLEAMDDAATVVLGSGTHTPTADEWRELMNNTTSTWATRNGVYGRLLTASNGNSLFLPAAGNRYGAGLHSAATYGLYWTSSLNTDHPWYFGLGSGFQGLGYDIRRIYGYSVRPVRSAQTTPAPCTTTYGDTTASATGSFNWHGVYYTAGGDYRDTLTNARGCDSVLTLHLTIANSSSGGVLPGVFSVADGRRVRFAQGHLQYSASQGTHAVAGGGTAQGTWRFAPTQYSIWTTEDSAWIGTFCWGTSGWNSGANLYMPTDNSAYATDFYPGGASTYDLTGDYAYADWGVYNAISNGGNVPGLWRTLTYEEWLYLFATRQNASSKFALGLIDGIIGLVILPDDFTLPAGCSFTPGSYSTYIDGIFLGSASNNSYSLAQWAEMEAAGAVFFRGNSDADNPPYWSASHYTGTYGGGNISEKATRLAFNHEYMTCSDGNLRNDPCAVRLVQNVEASCATTYGDTTATATGPFSWHGRTCTASGDYRDTLVNAAGCDSVLTLHLTLATPPSAGPWVDLGLPSGLLWASCNLGANAPESYGNYYAWAETATKANYSWNTYRYGTYYNKLTKYCNDASYGLEGFTDTLTILRPGDDAATAATADGSIHTPTKAQWEELIGNTTGEWTTWNGVNGYRLTAPNGNSIFLPAGWGYLDIGLTGVGSSGGYWSSSLSTDYPGGACFFDFYPDNALMNCFVDRTMGFPIRAVKDTATRTCNTFSDTSATVVSRFNWHGNGYTVSGHYTRTLTNAAGCDSVIVLHLTIQPRQTAAGWVDLGLPSGLLWAESNLGANAPEEIGNYYAWGETTPKTEYTYVNYRFGHGEHFATRYCNDSSYGLYGYTDSLTTLLPTDDAATAALGNGFRTPTAEEWQELIDNTTSVYVHQPNGAYGNRFTATNGNSIFLPFSRGQDDWHHASAMVGVGEYGRYWSSTLSSYDPAHAQQFIISSSDPSIGDYGGTYSYRNGGYSVRAVQETSASHSCTTYGDTTAVATNRFRWHGTILPSSGDYTLIRTNTAGCDSIVTLHLTVHSTVPAGWVDLGLPSGMLWAESDLGSNTPEVPGNLYAWGETTPKAEYSWANYRYCNGEYDQLTKYCNDASYGYNGFTDTLTVLQPGDDAATVALGNGAHTPTKAEWDELHANCDRAYTTNWLRFIGPSGNAIYLPSGNGTYWTGTLSHSGCYRAFCITYDGDRYGGERIRAVRALQ